MPGGRKIDEAYVQVLPDLSQFGAQASRQITQALRGVQATVAGAAAGVDRELGHIGGNLQSAFTGVARSADQAFGHMDVSAAESAAAIATSYALATTESSNAFQGFQQSAEHDLTQVDNHVRTSAATMGTSFSKAGLAAKAALFSIGIGAVTGLGALAKMGLSSAANLEQVQISFNALLGSAQEGQRVFKQLQQFANVTPFEFPQIADAGKRFLAFANSVGMTRAQLLDYLNTIGNVISVTGGGADAFGRINLAIGQIGSASKVTLDNLNQIADAIPGFSPIAAIAKSMGITTAEAMKRVSQGSISAQQGVQALLQGMRAFPGAAGAMQKQSQTLLGVFSTFKDTVGQALAGAFQPVIPAIKNTLTSITPIIGGALNQLAPALGGVLVGLLTAVGPLIQGITKIVTPILAALGPALAALAPALGPLGDALAQIIIPLVPAIPAFAQFALVLVQLLIPAVQLLGLVLKPLAPILNFLALAIGQFGAWLRTIQWGAIGKQIDQAFVKSWQSVVTFFKNVGAFFAKLPGQLLKGLEALPRLILGFFKFLLDSILMAIGIYIGLWIALFTKVPGLVLSALMSLGPMLLHLFVSAVLAVENTIITWGARTLSWFQQLPGRIITAVAKLPGMLQDFFRRLWNDVEQRAENAAASVVNFFRGIPKKLSGFAGEVGKGIVDFLKGFLNHAINGINAGIAKVDAIVPGDLPRIPTLARGGIAFGPSIIGEDPMTGPEAAIPLGDSRALSLLRQALGGMGTTINFSPGAIVVNVNGDVSPQQANAIGQQVGQGIVRTLTTNNIKTAVRTT